MPGVPMDGNTISTMQSAQTKYTAMSLYSLGDKNMDIESKGNSITKMIG